MKSVKITYNNIIYKIGKDTNKINIEISCDDGLIIGDNELIDAVDKIIDKLYERKL